MNSWSLGSSITQLGLPPGYLLSYFQRTDFTVPRKGASSSLLWKIPQKKNHLLVTSCSYCNRTWKHCRAWLLALQQRQGFAGYLEVCSATVISAQNHCGAPAICYGFYIKRFCFSDQLHRTIGDLQVTGKQHPLEYEMQQEQRSLSWIQQPTTN